VERDEGVTQVRGTFSVTEISVLVGIVVLLALLALLSIDRPSTDETLEGVCSWPS
jgi:hypothetical protein